MKEKEKKNLFKNVVGGIAPQQKASRAWAFFLGLVDPSRNRLASTAYFAKLGFSVLHAHAGMQPQNKINKNLIFISIEPIPDLSCKCDYF